MSCQSFVKFHSLLFFFLSPSALSKRIEQLLCWTFELRGRLGLINLAE